MADKRNVLIDITRVAAAAGIIMSHVNLSQYGGVGTLLGQFLSVRFSLMFFLAVIGFYLEKACQAGQNPIRKRVIAMTRLYGAWSLVYIALSFVMVVVIGNEPLGSFLAAKVRDTLFAGSYYHFWFYPAVIWSLLFIGGAKQLLGQRAICFLLPLAIMLYALGLPGTGYLPLGQQIPGLRTFYGMASFEVIMHLALLGFPSVIFGMAAAHLKRTPSGTQLLIAGAAYTAEAVILCLVLKWRENPQMLITTPLLTVLFLRWAQQSRLTADRINPTLCRAVSAGMYNVHPLLLAALGLLMPGMGTLPTLLVCTAGSAAIGWMLFRLRKKRLISWFV